MVRYLNVACFFALWAVAAAVSGGPESALSPAAAPAAADCGTLIYQMVDCMSFLTNGGDETEPEESCCSGFESVVKTDFECICVAFSVSASTGIDINMTRAEALPSACRVSAPSFTTCDAMPPSESPNQPPTAQPPSATPQPPSTALTQPPSTPAQPPVASPSQAPSAPTQPPSAAPAEPPVASPSQPPYASTQPPSAAHSPGGAVSDQAPAQSPLSSGAYTVSSAVFTVIFAVIFSFSLLSVLA